MRNLILLILIILNAPNSIQNIEDCLFEECKCSQNYPDNSYDITCSGSKLYNFPQRANDSSNFTQRWINLFFITKFSFKVIPDDAFTGLKIKNLIIGDNKLETLSENAFRGIESLSMLRLIEKRLNKIESNSFKWLNQTLKEIGFIGTSLNTTGMDDLFKELKLLERLNTFKLNNVNLNIFKTEWMSILSNITYLSLASNGLKELDVLLFNLSSNLISVDLSHNNFSRLDQLFLAFKPIETKLKEIKLSGNFIETIPKLDNFTSLEHFDLSNNLVRIIPDLIFSNQAKLNYLNLASNNLSYLPEDSFSKCVNLITLKLHGNKLYKIPDIVNLSKLQVLDLSNQNGYLNYISDYALERKIKSFNSLDIRLEFNSIQYFGNRVLCSRYGNVTDIYYINLSYNSFKNLNKCILSTLKALSYSKIFFKIHQNEFKKVMKEPCDCETKTFAEYFSIDLSGVCKYGVEKCDTTNYDDSHCANRKEFECN